MSLRSRISRATARTLVNPRAYSVGSHRFLYRVIARGIAIPDGLSAVEVDADGVRATVVQGARSDPPRDLFVVHGGGYSAGSLATHVPVCAGLCAGIGAAGLVVDYRRAPAHVYPAAHDDTLAAWKWWVSRPEAAGTARTAVYGDSAGAGLALDLMMGLRDAGEPLPRAAYLVSPFVDLTHHRRPPNHTIVDEILTGVGRIYTRGHDPRDPRISPIFGDLAGLPPMLIQAGTSEMLAQDGERLADRARESGVDVTFEPYESSIHELPLMTRVSSRARQLHASGCRYLAEHLQR